MKIKKTITLNLLKEGRNIICFDTTTLQMIMGAKSVIGNYQQYQVTKEKNRFIVPIRVIKERIEELSRRRKKLDESVEIMKQIVE